MSQAAVNERPASPNGWLNRFLNGVEKAGNKLPDPAMLFLYALLIVWVGSWIGSQFSFDLVNPRTGEAVVVNNLLTGAGLAEFLASMVTTLVIPPFLGAFKSRGHAAFARCCFGV